MQASVTRDAHLVFLCIPCSWFLPTSLLSRYTLQFFCYFCCLSQKIPKAPGDVCFDTTKLACLQTFEVPTIFYRLKTSKPRYCLLNK